MPARASQNVVRRCRSPSSRFPLPRLNTFHVRLQPGSLSIARVSLASLAFFLAQMADSLS